jgi:hypothetical protein
MAVPDTLRWRRYGEGGERRDGGGARVWPPHESDTRRLFFSFLCFSMKYELTSKRKKIELKSLLVYEEIKNKLC